MIVLAVDSASRSSSAAIVGSDSVLAETTLVKNETHSRHIMGMIDGVLTVSGLDIRDVSAFAVTVGPGSFTGVRIAVSAVKGMAFATGKPVVGISTLDALAAPVSQSRNAVCAMMDARRGEVYYARYACETGEMQKTGPEQVAQPAEAIEKIDTACCFVGDGAVAYRSEIVAALGSRAEFRPHYDNIVRAAVVGALAFKQLDAGSARPPETLAPQYLRKSDAEINLERKQQS